MMLMKTGTKEQIREQEITAMRGIDSRQDTKDAERTKQFKAGRISRRWPRRLTLDESWRTPFQFTWRC